MRSGLWLVAAALLTGPLAPLDGPFDIPMFATSRVPGATAHARLLYAPSPFGIAVTADGRAIYDARVTISALPTATALGPYTAYIAWAVTPDLSRWVRLGVVANGSSTVGPIDMNKFLLVIVAAPDSASTSHAGPTVLHGTSPSGWLQTFLSHPLFRGIPWGG